MQYGRQVIYTDAKEITAANVIDVLTKANQVHQNNQCDIDTLYKYYKGEQAIENRVKDIRPEINNKICENRANEIVTFKTGYLVGEPVVYTSRKAYEKYNDEIQKINEYMYLEGKTKKDKSLVDWMHIAGTAYRLVIPRTDYTEDEAPFEFYTLSPRNAYIIYGNDLRNTRLAGVQIIYDTNDKPTYYVWTKERLFIIRDNKITNSTTLVIDDKEETESGQIHLYGNVPMVEYPLNDARLGAFEIVMSLLDAINEIASDRIDGVDQFVQSLMTFCNCDIDETTFKALKDLGCLKYKSDSSNPAKVEILSQEMNQMETQTLVDYMYEAVLTICGMPNRNGGSSTSDTGSAVIMRDGWSAAEARAKDTENMFEESEKDFLKIVLSYLKNIDTQSALPLGAIKTKFTRRNYEDITTKANVLVTMLNNEKIHPLLAFDYCGMFPDGEAAYAMSKEYWENIASEKTSALLEELRNGEELNT